MPNSFLIDGKMGLESQCGNKVRIVVVDDHPIVREHLGEMIRREGDLEVCGEAESRLEALDVIRATQPNLVIVDLTLKDSHGLELIKDIRVMDPGVSVLVVSMQEETLYAERSIRAGAQGYITKQEATRNILQAIRQVLNGGMYLSPAMAVRISASIIGKAKAGSLAGVESLTDRELQVFELLGSGLGTKEIAHSIHLDVKTIETYRARIKEKLNLRDASELVRRAVIWHHQRL